MSKAPESKGRPWPAAPVEIVNPLERSFRSTKYTDAHHLDDGQTTAEQLLHELRRAGISLVARRGRIVVQGRLAGLTVNLLERLRERQAELLALLVEVAR